MSDSQSGTIDGVSYASSKYVYDPNGLGFVTDILYYDQAGKQVADRTIFIEPPFPVSDRTVNPDGTFSIKITTPPGDHGGESYLIESFSRDGIWLGEDAYSGTAGNVAETAHSVVTAVGPGSSGTIDGSYYDMVIRDYTPAGRLVSTSYYYDINGSYGPVATQWSPNPSLALSPTATVTAGASGTSLYASFNDPWATGHAGSLVLNISVDAGTVSGSDAYGHSFAATPGSAVHFTGTMEQITSAIASLSFADQSPGTAHLTLQVYDQAGLSDSRSETITVTPPAVSPNPVIGGPGSLTLPADGTAHAVGATLSDPWAANHAGSLALNVSTSIGALTDTANGATTSGTSLHLTGSYSQIQADLSGLSLSSSAAGTGTVRIEIYDQAGAEAVHVVGVTVQPAASA